MTAIEKNKTTSFVKFAAIIGYMALLCGVVFAIWKLGNVWIERIVNSQQQQVSQTIIKTINEQAKLDLLMPDVVFINMDSTHKKQLNDSILKQIAIVVTKKYIGNEKVNSSEINFQPFFVLPDSVDSKGNYSLTKVQLGELKNDIQFLALQVDHAVTTTKQEIANDIERLNTWVSIWIGVIGFLGIFIPIVINFKINEELKDIKQSASNAGEIIKKHKPDIESIAGLKNDVVEMKENIVELKKDAAKAKEDAGKATEDASQAIINAAKATEKATKGEKLVSILNVLSKIKDIDSSFLLYNPQPFETLKIYLEEIHADLSNCPELFDEPIVKDIFRQLALKLHLIAPSDFISPANFDLLNQFAFALSNIISQPITQDTFNHALALLGTLNTSLNT